MFFHHRIIHDICTRIKYSVSVIVLSKELGHLDTTNKQHPSFDAPEWNQNHNWV